MMQAFFKETRLERDIGSNIDTENSNECRYK